MPGRPDTRIGSKDELFCDDCQCPSVCDQIDDVVNCMRSSMRISVRMHGVVDSAQERLGAYLHVESVEQDAEGFTLHFSGDERGAVELLAAMIRDGLPVCGFNEHKFDMEDILLESGARDAS